MPASVVIGTQWGDEGKGKATDYLADHMDLVVRYQGGNNAGHTVVAGGHLLKLHLIPSGILYPHITSVIAGGVVVDPGVLLEEMDALTGQGIDVSRLVLSGNAHLIMPYHLALEKVTERYLGRHALGTTKRGIGPAYADRAARIGLRVQDLLDPKIFREKLEVVLKEKNLVLTKVYNRLPLEASDIEERYLAFGERLRAEGGEYGTTTGRPRRCGWYDAVVLRYATRVNGLTELFLTKLDVLSGLDTVRVCTAYRYEGRVYEDLPPHQTIVHKAEAVFEELEGWPDDLGSARSSDELPPAARKYVEWVADLGGVPVRMVSVGPSR